MKKTLWTLAALALAGVCFTSCDETVLDGLVNPEFSPVDNEKYCAGTCGGAEGTNCFTNDINSTDKDDTFCSSCRFNCALKFATDGLNNCVQAEIGSGWGCANNPTCPEGQGFKVATDGTAKCESLNLNSCQATSDCGDGQICDMESHQCVDADEPEHFTLVRIEDASEGQCVDKNGASKLNSKGFCTLDDPGADIDAVVLIKPGQAPIYATDVIGYQRADGIKTLKDAQDKKADGVSATAADPDAILRAPDSFNTYGANFDGTCKYWVDPQASDENKKHPYVSLGGKGGYIEVEMGGHIEDGDKIDVLEVGECTLTNTKDGGSQKAQADKVRVKVAINTEGGEVWKSIGEDIPTATNKGILTFNVTAAALAAE